MFGYLYMEPQENVSLSTLTTIRLGGPARYVTRVHSVAELTEAVAWGREHHQPLLVIGGGSNVLFSEKGWNGLLLQMCIQGVTYEENDNSVRVIAGAGVVWDDFVAETVARGLFGIENLSYIPGTVGGTPVQNVGAYGVEVKEVIEWVEVFDPEDGTLHTLSNTECGFGYRTSIFKESPHTRLIIVRVAFLLKKEAPLSLDYKDVQGYFSEHAVTVPTLHDVRAAIVAIRQHKLPDPRNVGTVGSFFKNPIIPAAHYALLQQQYGGVPGFILPNDMVKIPLAWFLDRLGWKGVRRGSVGVWESQPLALVHYGGGTVSELRALADEIKEDVRIHTGLRIEEEVRML